MDSKIGINIWDDFYDDGFVPEGEVQKTYAYVEESMDHQECKVILEALKLQIHRFFSNDWLVKASLEFYDSAKEFPNLVGSEYEWMLCKKWRLNLENQSHEKLDALIDHLDSWGYLHKDIPVVVYSES